MPALFACLLLAGAASPRALRAQAGAGAQPPAPRTKRVTPLRKSDSAQGSRVTITSDGGALSDYSAYRSGDRFIVVIAQAEAVGGGGGLSGRGFQGAQVSKRGNDVVYTFKLEPGATARVNQRFNQLDVQFTTQKQAAPAQPATSATPAATPTPRTPRTPAALAGIASPTPAPRATPDSTRLVQTDPKAQKSPAAGVAPPAGTSVTTPTPADASPSFAGFAPMPELMPAVAQTPEQIAQVLPPPAPVSATSTSAPAPRRTLGATVINNWPWMLAALLAVGIALLFVGRLGSRREDELPPVASSPPALKERPAAKNLKGATAAAPVESAAKAVAVPLVAKAAPVVMPVPVVAKEAKPELSAKAAKPKKLTKVERRREKQLKAAAEKRGAVKTTVAGQAIAENEAAGIAETVEATAAAKPDATAALTPDATPTIKPDVATVKADAAAVSAHVPAEEKGIVLGAADAEVAGAEVQKLLAGEAYAESVVGAPDSATRQLVAAELSAALASRNAARNTRARAAFLKHGYFEDAARDLQRAEAPAQRAAAALSLALLHDRTATPHLVAALEDPSPDVRRASIEALSGLKDPAACAPLEALRRRESSRQVPQSLIRHAIDACTPAAADADETLVANDETTTGEPTSAVPVAAEAASVEPDVDETARAEAPAAETRTIEAFPLHAPAFESQPNEVVESESSVVESRDPAPAGDELTALEQPDLSSEPARDALSADATTASRVYIAPEFAVSRGAGAAADDWIEVEEPKADELFAPDSSASAATTDELLSGEAEAEVSFEVSFEVSSEPRHQAASEFPAEEIAEARPAAAEEMTIDIAPEAKGVELAAEGESVESVRETSVIEWAAAPGRASFVEPEVETELPISPDEAAPLGIALVEDAEPARARGLAAVEDADVEPDARAGQKGLAPQGADDELSIIPKAIQLRLDSSDASERAESVLALARLDTGEAYKQICDAFDDRDQRVRDAAARALYEVAGDRAESYTRALREAAPERRRNIGAALANSGLAEEAISQLTGESRDKTYDAFTLLFLMAKAGETAPLIHAIGSHPDNEVRLAVVKLLALSGQQEVLSSFRRLAVRGSLPTEVRSAVMEAIYQISGGGSPAAPNRAH